MRLWYCLVFLAKTQLAENRFCRFSRDDAWGRLLLVRQGAAVGSHFAGGGVDSVGAVHVGFDGFVAAEAAVGGAHGPAEGDEGPAGGFGDAGVEVEGCFGGGGGRVFARYLWDSLGVAAGR